jgi:hypothetical protein
LQNIVNVSVSVDVVPALRTSGNVPVVASCVRVHLGLMTPVAVTEKDRFLVSYARAGAMDTSMAPAIARHMPFALLILFDITVFRVPLVRVS